MSLNRHLNSVAPLLNRGFYSASARADTPNSAARVPLVGTGVFDTLILPDQLVLKHDDMINASNYNVVNVDLNNNENSFDFLLQFNNKNDSGNATTTFTTKITPNSKKHFSFPVQQQFINYGLYNPGTSNTTANGSVTFSRFTQYNNHLQNENQSDQFTMNTCVRPTNDYNEDIALGRCANINEISINSFTPSFSNISPRLLGYNPTQLVHPNTSAGVNVVSTDNADTGEITITGVDDNYNLATQTFNMTGTTLVTSNVPVLYLNFVTVSTNYGDISLSYNGMTQVIPAGHHQLRTSSYTQPEGARSVLKSFDINGTSGWDNNSIILKKNVGTTLYTIDTYKIIDNNNINIHREPNMLLEPRDTIYFDMVTSGISPETYNTLTCNFQIHEYSDNPTFK